MITLRLITAIIDRVEERNGEEILSKFKIVNTFDRISRVVALCSSLGMKRVRSGSRVGILATFFN